MNTNDLKTVYVDLSYTDAKANFDEIKNVFEYAQTHKISKIVFPRGRYEVENTKSIFLLNELLSGNFKMAKCENPLAKLNKTDNIEIDGGGVHLVFSGLLFPFDFVKCNNVTISDITVDWKRPIFSEGTVLECSGDELTVKIDDEYPVSGGEPVVSYQDYNPSDGSLTGFCVFENIDSFKLIGKQTAVLKHRDAFNVKKGNRIVLRHMYAYSSCFHFYKCKNVSIKNVTLNTALGMGIICHRCTDVNFENLSVLPQSGRLISTNTDATHLISCMGDVKYKNCSFTSMGDDACNVHGFYMICKKIIDERHAVFCIRASVQDGILEIPDVNDKIEFISGITLKAFSESEVISKKSGSNPREVILEFKDPLPDNYSCGDFIANISKTAKLIFDSCRVSDVRGRGVLVQTRGAIIENSVFSNCTGQGIHIDTAVGWDESVGTRDIVIKNNKFLNCGYGMTKYCDACALVIETECEKPEAGVHGNITVSGNYIDSSNVGMLIRCSKDVTVENNTFKKGDYELISVSDSENVIVRDNYEE